MHDTPPEIERLRAAARRRPDELVPVEEAEDAVWDVITRMNEEPAPPAFRRHVVAEVVAALRDRPDEFDGAGSCPEEDGFLRANRPQNDYAEGQRVGWIDAADYIEQRYGTTDPDVADERPISPRSVLVAHPREGDVRFDAYPGRDLIGDVARFAAGGLGITVGSDHATLAVGGVLLDADEPLPDMPRFDLVLIGGVV